MRVGRSGGRGRHRPQSPSCSSTLHRQVYSVTKERAPNILFVVFKYVAVRAQPNGPQTSPGSRFLLVEGGGGLLRIPPPASRGWANACGPPATAVRAQPKVPTCRRRQIRLQHGDRGLAPWWGPPASGWAAPTTHVLGIYFCGLAAGQLGVHRMRSSAPARVRLELGQMLGAGARRWC
jgi:hypothetical protein